MPVIRCTLNRSVPQSLSVNHLVVTSTCTSGHKITVVENREFKQQQRLQLSQKTSLKNKHLRKHDYFVIIAHCKTLHLEISRPTRRLADQVKENVLKCALQALHGYVSSLNQLNSFQTLSFPLLSLLELSHRTYGTFRQRK